MITVGSLFSGIGGIGLAFRNVGYKIEFQVEIDDYCRKVLKANFPEATRFSDIRKVGKQNLPTVDVLVGGFPCQPHSIAGNQKGEDDHRNLWPDFARIIGELRPRVVLLENVPGILSATTDADGNRRPAYALTVLRDLSEMGYDAEWAVIPASATGAPHKRDRWFCVAYSNKPRSYPVSRGKKQAGQRVIGGNDTIFKPGSAGREKRHIAEISEISGHPTRRHDSASAKGTPERAMGSLFDGLSGRLAGHSYSFPAGQGTFQFEWEPQRAVYRPSKLEWIFLKMIFPSMYKLLRAYYRMHKDAIKALGNAVVPQVVEPIAERIREVFFAEMEMEKVA